jgi:hypothetical protein
VKGSGASLGISSSYLHFISICVVKPEVTHAYGLSLRNTSMRMDDLRKNAGCALGRIRNGCSDIPSATLKALCRRESRLRPHARWARRSVCPRNVSRIALPSRTSLRRFLTVLRIAVSHGTEAGFEVYSAIEVFYACVALTQPPRNT